MLTAILILMIGFVGGVAVTVALGVGLYKLTDGDEDMPERVKKDSPAAAAHASPAGSAYAPPYRVVAPTPPRTLVDMDDWRY